MWPDCMADDCPVMQCCLPETVTTASHRDGSDQTESGTTTRPDTFDSFGQTSSSESIPTLMSLLSAPSTSHQNFKSSTKPSIENREVVPLDVVPNSEGNKSNSSSTTRGSMLAPTTIYLPTQTKKLFFFASNPAGSHIDQNIISSYISTTHGTSNGATGQHGLPGQPGLPTMPNVPPGEPYGPPGRRHDKHSVLPGHRGPPGSFGFGPFEPRDVPRFGPQNDYEVIEVPPSLDNRGLNLNMTPKQQSASSKPLLTASNTISHRVSPTKTTTSDEVGFISRNT